MAKKSVLNRNEKRMRMVANKLEKRKVLKSKAIDPKASPEEQDLARWQLQNLPRNSSPSRVVSRCQITGRARGVYKKFRLGRNKFREMALEGLLPGVTKASW